MSDNQELNETPGFELIDKKADVGIKWNSVSLIYSAIIQFITLTILARIFSVEEYGIMGFILIIIGFGSIYADIGVSGAIIHYQDSSQDQLSSLYWISILFGFCIFISVFLTSNLVALFFNEPTMTLYIQYISIIFCIIPIGQQFETLLMRELAFKPLAFNEILNSTIMTIFSILLAFFGWGIMSIVFGYILKYIIKSFVMVLIGIKIWKPSFKIKRSEIRKYFSFGLYQVGERTINYFNINFDKILIGRFLGTLFLGYYLNAYNLVSYPVTLINPIFNRVSFPYLSKLQNNLKKLKEKYFEFISLVSFVNFPIYLLLFLIAPVLVPFLYGAQWNPSIILVQILSFVFLFRCINNPIGSLLLAKGYARLGFFWNLLMTTIQPFIILLGIYLGGINEVAFVILLSRFIVFYLFYRVLIRKILGPCLKEYITSFKAFLIFSILSMLIASVSILIFNTLPLLIQIMCYTAILGMAYLSLVYIFKKQFLSDFLKRFLKKQ